MRREIPMLLRCCFCFPLRYGLLLWAYIKQILSLVCFASMIFKVYIDSPRMTLQSYVEVSAIITLIIVDFVFYLFLIISAHTENCRLMRIFYRYSIALLCLTMIGMAWYIRSWFIYIFSIDVSSVLLVLRSNILPAIGATLVLFIVQAYFIILVRSEFNNLKNKSQTEFVSNAFAEKCTAKISFDKRTEENVA
ncbi:uncharacterized protein LOC120631484 [Pararge aegeria]|uniref:uncharacterized protein LOC120631484 n=1 Tax=Pararge aegeria TaxID=116150 RepID=UPI0019D1F7A6|nr:uncharacterized protein LOC120631484 [Pararge aegeria]